MESLDRHPDDRHVDEALGALREAPVPDGPPDDVMQRTLQRLAAAERWPALPSVFARIQSMRPTTRYAAAAGFLFVAAVVVLTGLAPRHAADAYALEQTMEAVKAVRFMHLKAWLPDGTLRDERWIEIGPDGRQVRYRQETKRDECRFVVVEDDGQVAVFRDDKQAVILYTSEQQQYQWVGDFHQFFADMAGDSSVVIEPNVEYKGRPAHRVRWLRLNTQCYVDPESKLPIHVDDEEIAYEEPPPGTFDLVVPEGYTVVDTRPGGAPVDLPDWLRKEQEVKEAADRAFHEGRFALAEKDYAKAEELFGKTVEGQPGRNWAWFWLGEARSKQGDYDGAIECYDCVIEMFADDIEGACYCWLARGMAYARKARLAEPEAAEAWRQKARADFGNALPTMIGVLRDIRGARMYDFADDPLIRNDPKRRPSPEESFGRMIERLRAATGENFGYRPNAGPEERERVIAAWEAWWAKHKAEYGVKP